MSYLEDQDTRRCLSCEILLVHGDADAYCMSCLSADAVTEC